MLKLHVLLRLPIYEISICETKCQIVLRVKYSIAEIIIFVST